MRLKAENWEVRGCEEKISTKTGNPYLIVRAEDETGLSVQLIDRNPENKDFYKRGTVVDFYLNLQTGKYTSLSIYDVKIHTDH